MGDIIQTIPPLVRLREDFPGVEITLLCVCSFSEILKSTPLVNRYVKIDTESAIKLKNNDPSTISHLLEHPFLKEYYDLVINLTHDLSSSIIAKNIKARSKTGKVGNTIEDWWGKYLFSVVNNREENSFNLVDIHIGMAKVKPKPVRNYLFCDPRIEASIKKFLGSSFVVSMHIGANKLHRAWKVEHFAKVGAEIAKTFGATIVITGSGKEIRLSEEFLYWWKKLGVKEDKIIDTTGRTRLQHLIAILKNSRLLISNDTGPIHIASAVGTPTLGVYLSTAYPGETAPYGENHIVIHPLMECYPCKDEASDFPCKTLCKEKVLPEDVSMVAVKMLEGEYKNLESIINSSVVLRSRFLSNGTTFYEPAGGYEGLDASLYKKWTNKIISRLIWEKILQLESDPTLLNRAILQDLLEGISLWEEIIEGKKPLPPSILKDFIGLTQISDRPFLIKQQEYLKFIKFVREGLGGIRTWLVQNFPSA